MVSQLLVRFLFRLIIPTTLIGACIVRFNALSVIYLLFLLAIPLIPSPQPFYFKGSIVLQLLLLITSVVFILAHIVFQIVTLSYGKYGMFIPFCSAHGKLANHMGFNRFDECKAINIVRLLLPDVVVFLTTLVAYMSSRSLQLRHAGTDNPPRKNPSILQAYVPAFSAVMLLLAGIMVPNALSATYFLCFLVGGLCWAFHMKTNATFFFLKILLTFYAALHVLLLYMYQFDFFQHILVPNSFTPRLLGLPAIINNHDCHRMRELILNTSLPWPNYVLPFAVFVLYWLLAVEIRFRVKKNESEYLEGIAPLHWWNACCKPTRENSPLLESTSPHNEYGSVHQPELPSHVTPGTEQSTAEDEGTVQSGTFSSVVMFFMGQSYIPALIIMMTWSITFHNWLTFVLLLWACLSWITPYARWFYMMSSPYLVVYAQLMLVSQYVYGIDLTDAELPMVSGSFHFSELGLVKTVKCYTDKCGFPVLQLGAQTLFTVVFLVTLRQHIREKKLMRVKTATMAGEVVLKTLARPIVQAFKKRSTMISKNSKENNLGGEEELPDEATEFIVWMKNTLAKYWVLVCCVAFLVVALQAEVSIFQIVYMVIFLVGFIVYKFSLRTWKTILSPLWWFMVVYSILQLLTIYTYQFKNIQHQWSNGTHLSQEWLLDIGLRRSTQTHLLIELLIPTLFSITIVIQLHFFHAPLIKKINRLLKLRKRRNAHRLVRVASSRTDSTHSDSTLTTNSSRGRIDSPDDTTDEIEPELDLTISARIRKGYQSVTVVLWRLAEIHIQKLVSFVVIMVVVQQVSALNAVFVLLLALAMPSHILQRFLSYLMIVWSSVIVLGYMFYQLRFVEEKMLDKNCTNLTRHPLTHSHFSSNAWWVGLHKSQTVPHDVRGYLFIVLVIVFEKVVKHHQELLRFRNIMSKPPAGVLFPEITRKSADDNILNCVKYLCNNFFMLFGFELNLMSLAICMCVRGDIVAVIYSLWLALFLLVRRKKAAHVWPFFVCFHVVILPLQYILVLGWPPGLCKGYVWDDWNTRKLVQWLFLSDVSHPQNQYLLVADYFQFLLACCQWNVFHTEKQARRSTHSSLYKEENTPADFMQNKTWLDLVKIIVFDQFLWFTLSIVYVTAQTTTSLFNSGFLVGCFFFLWHGQGLYLRPRKAMRRWWKTFILFNFFVILAKIWLQLVSCVYVEWIHKNTSCYLVQLLNLYCLRAKDYGLDPWQGEEAYCNLQNGMTMDCVCFVVLIIQYLIFKSPYFKFVIREHRRQSEMAFSDKFLRDRNKLLLITILPKGEINSQGGAQLVEERLQVHLKLSIDRDEEMMQTIRNKVSKLKRRLAELNPKAQEPLSHYEAIYAGDYYLFEDSDTESDTSEEPSVPVITDDVISEDVTVAQQDQTQDTQQATLGSQFDLENTRNDFLEEGIGGDGLRRRRSPVDETQQQQQVTTEEEIISPTEEEAPKPPNTFKRKVTKAFTAMRTFFVDLANSTINVCDQSSHDYRYIATQLRAERIHRAKSLSQSKSESLSRDKVDQPELFNSSSSGDKDRDDSDTWSWVEDENLPSWTATGSVWVRLTVSVYNALLANSNLLCYTLMIVNHMYYASVLSMPLPFFVFLWGMLSIPRPNKHFWIVIITYVQLVIVVKYIFQFQFPSSNDLHFNECEYYGMKEEKSPLCPPRIIGIERNTYSSVCDLLLLLGLFFHRFALKAHGLWRERTYSDEEDLTPRHTHQDSTTLTFNDTLLSVSENAQSETAHVVSMVDRSINRTISAQNKSSIFESIRGFIHRMLDPAVGMGAVDVYAWMFGAQFLVFAIILFNWSAFSSNQETKSNFAKIFEENVVPKTFLYMLLTQFLLMLLDRYLYMRKYVFAKFVYLAVLVFLFHVFIFLIVPELTQRSFSRNVPALFMYLFQCVYFALSAYQVRCGYPTRILGNFLTKNYSVTSAILFQGIQAIPFLLELRSVLDWVCTKTTLTLNHWLKMEDIYANTFILKCWRDSEKTFPHHRGVHYWAVTKWLIGGLLVVLLIVVIWFPLLFMSFISSAYISNPPVEATFTLTIGGYQPLFKVVTQQQFLKHLSQRDINIITSPDHRQTNHWDVNKVEQGFQDYRTKGSTMRIQVLSNSSAIWTISPPSRAYLIRDLESNSSISLRFKYDFDREPNMTQAALVQEAVSGITSRSLPPGDPIRIQISQVLKGVNGVQEIKIPRLFPSYIQIPARGSVKPVDWLGRGTYVNCSIILRNGTVPGGSYVEWWEIVQNQPKPMFTYGRGNLEVIALNDFVPPLHLSFFASKGIIGLYVGFVWLVGKFVRLFFTSISYRIMFDELPNVDRILKLCLEIYMVRESKELKLEEDLFAKLLFLYRSPETLIKWTKYKRL